MVWRLCALVAWGAATGGAALLDNDGLSYAIVGVVLAVAVGALVDRWWAVAASVIGTAVAVAILRTACTSRCDDWGALEAFAAYSVLFALPAAIAFAVGVGLRRLIRRADAADEPAYPPARRGSPPPGPVAP